VWIILYTYRKQLAQNGSSASELRSKKKGAEKEESKREE